MIEELKNMFAIVGVVLAFCIAMLCLSFVTDPVQTSNKIHDTVTKVIKTWSDHAESR